MNNGLNKLPWASYLHAILRIFSRGVFQAWQLFPLAAFGAVDEPLTYCMIVHFSAHVLKWKFVCKFRVRFHIFIVISSPGSRFHAWNSWFCYSITTFTYTKYFVDSYIVDVVFTRSYWNGLPWIELDISLQNNSTSNDVKAIWPSASIRKIGINHPVCEYCFVNQSEVHW